MGDILKYQFLIRQLEILTYVFSQPIQKYQSLDQYQTFWIEPLTEVKFITLISRLISRRRKPQSKLDINSCR